jgi:hypothetical protein
MGLENKVLKDMQFWAHSSLPVGYLLYQQLVRHNHAIPDSV